MLIVISPAKTLDYESDPGTSKHSMPDFVSDSSLIIEHLRKLSPPDIEQLMGISKKLADLNFGRYLNWSESATRDNAKQAMLAFKGDVYTGLQAENFSAKDLAYAQDHLRILSGLYGVLKPLDLMQPYRLEMGTRLETSRGKTLYEFWGNKLTEALNTQLKELGSDILVNLASNEYFKSVNLDKLEAEVVTPVFKDYKNGKYKVISFFAKKARGLMSAWIIQNRVTNKAGLKKFDVDGYKYNAAESQGNELVFLRDGSTS